MNLTALRRVQTLDPAVSYAGTHNLAKALRIASLSGTIIEQVTARRAVAYCDDNQIMHDVSGSSAATICVPPSYSLLRDTTMFSGWLYQVRESGDRAADVVGCFNGALFGGISRDLCVYWERNSKSFAQLLVDLLGSGEVVEDHGAYYRLKDHFLWSINGYHKA